MLTLRLVHRSEAGDAHAVDVSLDDGGDVERASSRFVFPVDAADREQLRWYLEDYLEFPLDPAPTLAAAAEARLGELGTGLFGSIFAGQAADLWARVRPRLGETRVEVAADPGDASLPWELLRDPRTDQAVALGARSFVRAHDQPARQPSLSPAGAQLRVLLVICRPGGRGDVPFRSVARRLVELGRSLSAFDLDVLRPPTYAAMAARLQAAKEAGRPYHVVHFDGHGTWADLSAGEPEDGHHDAQRYSMLSPVRAGAHGYLAFEDPDAAAKVQYVDGAALGRLLANTAVSVLVLNACRSAHAEAPTAPEADPEAAADLHARVRAYGSLAQEVVDAGVPGVVAMRYSVYVVTAAAFIEDLYAALLEGHELGEAVTRGRKGLADDPQRSIAYDPRPLQDWVVPVAYEAAPRRLFAPGEAERVVLDPGAEAVPGRIPDAPDVGFFGRDETLLGLDRAFDDHQVVVVWALAGAGKTATAAEFARWYWRTGGAEAVLWSSFERPITLPRLLDQVADVFAGVLGASDIHWSALSEPEQRNVALQLLGQARLLWVWDNVEGVAGFPPGAASAWTADEQGELRAFLGQVRATKARVLLTSRRPEHEWLGVLATRVELAPMPMRERVELARAVADRHGRRLGELEDWRPLLRYAEGNPLTTTMVVSQALRQGLATSAAIDAFVARLRAGQDMEDHAEAEGRSRSLGASLRYGFTDAFGPRDQARLALLGLFQGFVDADALVAMGNPSRAQHLAGLGGLGKEGWVGLLDRAAEAGLLSPAGGGYYRLHPALPWFLATTLAEAWGQADAAGEPGPSRAYAAAMGALGNYYSNAYEDGRHQVVGVLEAEEANLLHARRLAVAGDWWAEAIGTMQGLSALYDHQGRSGEWARLVEGAVGLYVEAGGDGPRPGRDEAWSIFTQYRVRLGRAERDWAAAERLQRARVDVNRHRAADALATPAPQRAPDQRNRIRSLGVSAHELGEILRGQGDPGCVEHYREAMALEAGIGDDIAESTAAFNLGRAYQEIPALRDLDQAEHWYQRSLELRGDKAPIRRARSLGQLGGVALGRFNDAVKAREPVEVLARHLNEAARRYHEALPLFPADDVADLAVTPRPTRHRLQTRW